MSQLWNKGRKTDTKILEFCVGDDHLLDARLLAYDVRASLGHAEMLKDCGHLTAEDFQTISTALFEIAGTHAVGDWEIAIEEEDVHTAIENRLVKKIGSAGARIHLGRSRNDQVLAALRLYLKDVVANAIEMASQLSETLRSLALAQGQIPIPGYTHLQPAMPSSVGDWAHAYAEELSDDIAALSTTLRRIDKNPLGSAAGYGVAGVKIDRERTREILGFAVVHEPVTAVQLSRGKAEADLVFQLSLLVQDIGRMAADLCLFNSSEFALVELPKEFCTGSSIMPQKNNPDVFELLRAKAAMMPSELTAIMALTSKMTSGYHRDLQLIKAPLFRAIDTSMACLEIADLALKGVNFVEVRCRESMRPELYAAEQAYRLVVEQGIPFRDAYRQVAKEIEAGSKGQKE